MDDSYKKLSGVESYSLNGTQWMMNPMTTKRRDHGCSTIEKNNVTMVIVAGGQGGCNNNNILPSTLLSQLLLQVTAGRHLVASRPSPCRQKKTLPRPSGIKLGLYQMEEDHFLSSTSGTVCSSWEERMIIRKNRTQYCLLMMGEKTGMFCRTDWRWEVMLLLLSA